MKLIKSKKKYSLEVKRLYLPIKLAIECPECKTKLKKSLYDEYLSYPTVNKIEPLVFYCEKCEGEYEVDTILRVSFEIDDKKITKL